jgi:hypothetical protein
LGFGELAACNYDGLLAVRVGLEEQPGPVRSRFFFSFGEKYRQAAINTVSGNIGNTGRNTGEHRPKFVN